MSRKQLFIISFGITLILIITGFMIKVLYKNENKQPDISQEIQETIEVTTNNKEINKQTIPQDSSLNSILPEDIIVKKDWPIDIDIPEPEDIIIETVTSDELMTAITFESDIATAKSHLQTIKNKGYRTTYQVITGDNIAYEGVKRDKTVNLSYYETGLATTKITTKPVEVVELAPEHNNTDQHINNRPSIETQKTEWPYNSTNGLPSLKGDISNIDRTMNSVIITLENVGLDDMYNYIELVKSSGYTQDAVMDSTSESIVYKGTTPINTFISIYYESTGTAIIEIGQN